MSHYQQPKGRKGTPSAFKDVFEELLQAYSLKDRFIERKLVGSWGELMGNTVARRTSDISIKDKTLYVKLSSGSLKNELMMNKSKVLQLIVEKFGPSIIKDIVFL